MTAAVLVALAAACTAVLAGALRRLAPVRVRARR